MEKQKLELEAVKWSYEEIAGKEFYMIPECDFYVRQEDGLFTYVAHPDLINFVGDEKIYQKHMRRLCRAAKECDIPLEINLLGLRENRQYPRQLFWELAAEEGCTVVLGSDAHRPVDVVDPVTEEKAMTTIRQLALNYLETPLIRKI